MNRMHFLRLGLFAPIASLLRLPAVRATPVSIGEAAYHIGDAAFPIVDLHCHPSLKMYLWQEHLWARHFPSPGDNPIVMQIDTRELGHGYVKGMLGAHYLLEAASVKQWNLLRGLYPWIKHLWHSLANKIEHEDASNFTQINIMIDTLENQVYLCNQRQEVIQFVVARNFADFKRIADTPGQIAIAHAIEGGHALGRKFPISEKRKQLFQDHPARKHAFGVAPANVSAEDAEAFPYIRNLEALHARGVCLMTIVHFFANDLAHPTEGVSADEKKKVGFPWNYDPDRDNLGLKAVGIAVVRHMLKIGMIVDLTHSTPACRRDAFGIAREVNAERKAKGLDLRPLAFTHVGLQSIFMKYDHRPELQNYKFYDIDPEEISAISECEGIMGVVPENFWLVGADRKEQGAGIEPGNYRDGIQYIVETMVAINELTIRKDFSNIGIGTDFDGLADAPRDLFAPRQLGALIEAIHTKVRTLPGMTDQAANDIVRAITSGNAYRVLERGWE
jgi:microsomal dipeptidase-like Zn-dependent dipeptidase